VYAYVWSGGWGSKYADPAVVPANGYGVSYNSTASAVAYANSGTFNTYVYPWSAGFGTRYADPASGSFYKSVSFHTSGQSIVSDGLTNLVSWAWSNGFGTKHADPIAISNVNFGTNTSKFSDDGKIFGIAFNPPSPYYALYSYTPSSGFGFRYSVPAFSASSVYSIAFK
jgi:hypothetical protein